MEPIYKGPAFLVVADAAECIAKIIDQFGVNQALYLAAEAIEKRATACNDDSATSAALHELGTAVEVLAIRAQRMAL